MLLVSEIFGPTVQGEGASLGQCAVFVRLGLCNLTCAWCDTPFTWDRARFDLRQQLTGVSREEIWERIRAVPAPLVVITGGEPLIQQRRLTWLIDRCCAAGRLVEIETNGTLVPSRPLQQCRVQFNVSVKLANSGVPAARRIRPEAIRALAKARTRWKFIVTGIADLEEIAELQNRFGLSPIWVMPEGSDAATSLRLLQELADPVLARGWNLTPRLHVLLWGDERGR
ncbi:7-carboxy-7-deazaguanine synthase QueE [Actinomadura rupiterrae]|uniref:7-carboxy-7-deazaguanine synthase QueE n=1 Tax=Actinomadura rupiterrae TaxID=559627 RepID=UPI0020A2EFAB|nr:7-carboxy-7-deazaguanine synthase QueE [Actinomadura rupiterrae]MCP2342956.1 7-cyano-7-deazaguanosine (preQ0) biosynthesis protein QueE [Actinomadura rupiterrae]